jgi:capsular polysaccharide biosynthesis protein
MNKANEYVRIDLIKILEGCIHRIWMILLVMLLCGSLLFSYAAFYITPMYRANVLMYVNNSSFSVGATSISFSSSQISAAKSLVETYLVILKARMTLDEVIRVGGLDCSYESLSGMISAESVNDTEVFSVAVTCADPYEAEHIANTIAQVLPDKIASVVEGSSVRIVDYAVIPSRKVSPNVTMYTLLGLMAGFGVSVLMIAVRETMDDRIFSEEYLLENFRDIPLLAVVPDMLDDRSKGSYYRKGYGRRYGYGYRHRYGYDRRYGYGYDHSTAEKPETDKKGGEA